MWQKKRCWDVFPTMIKLNLNKNPQTGTGTIWTGLHPGQKYSTIQFWLEFFFQIAVHKQHHKHLSRLQKQYKKEEITMNQDLPFLSMYFKSKFKKKQQNLVILPQILPVLKKKEKKKKSHFNTSWISSTINARFSFTVVHSYPGSSTSFAFTTKKPFSMTWLSVYQKKKCW